MYEYVLSFGYYFSIGPELQIFWLLPLPKNLALRNSCPGYPHAINVPKQVLPRCNIQFSEKYVPEFQNACCAGKARHLPSNTSYTNREPLHLVSSDQRNPTPLCPGFMYYIYYLFQCLLKAHLHLSNQNLNLKHSAPFQCLLKAHLHLSNQNLSLRHSAPMKPNYWRK